MASKASSWGGWVVGAWPWDALTDSVYWLGPWALNALLGPDVGCCAKGESGDSATGGNRQRCMTMAYAPAAAAWYCWASMPHIVLTYSIHSTSGFARRNTDTACPVSISSFILCLSFCCSLGRCRGQLLRSRWWSRRALIFQRVKCRHAVSVPPHYLDVHLLSDPALLNKLTQPSMIALLIWMKVVYVLRFVSGGNLILLRFCSESLSSQSHWHACRSSSCSPSHSWHSWLWASSAWDSAWTSRPASIATWWTWCISVFAFVVTVRWISVRNSEDGSL